MSNQAHTTLTFFHFSSVREKWWMFTQMGLAANRLRKTKGVNFGRLLGSGGGNGFSLWPNLATYAWLAHWDSESSADTFFNGNSWFKAAKARSSSISTFHLRPTMAHGQWEGRQPFTISHDYDPTQPVAVITRATVRASKLLDFWRYVPSTSKSVYKHPERLLSVGIGEYPVFMQATFSYWSSGKAMQEFAYNSEHHKEVIKHTRQRNWYKEELFARFTVLKIEGDDPFKLLS